MKNSVNKDAIVTGAASGIGKAVALLHASEVVKVVVNDRNEKNGNETVSLIESQDGEAIFIKGDTSNPENQKSTVERIVKKYGGLHIAYNNAGIGGDLVPTGDYPIDDWDKIISIDLSDVFYGLRYQIPATLSTGEDCSIVNMESILVMVGSKNVAGYVAAKHGVVGLTKTAALDYTDKQIRINAVGPRYINTPLLSDSLDEDSIKSPLGLHPSGRLGASEEVAELVLWLSFSNSSFMTGSYYTIDFC